MAAIVETQDGKLQGTTGLNLDGKPFFKFFGIRYAKVPVGNLRFKPPQPIEPWEGIKDATQVGDRCVSRDDLTLELGGSEDCLSLNVYCRELPSPNLKPRAVMVYIHGGGFFFGCNRPGLLGPEFLMTKDIVLVTINYRLGILGFLSVDGTEVTGNMGLKDQNLALKWVQRNIGSFGGDPNNVTIFGESAGSASVHAHILSSRSKGLFHKAILQSGCTLNSWFYGQKNNARQIVSYLGKNAATEKEALEILMMTDAFDIYAAQEKFPDVENISQPRPFNPVIEAPSATAFLTENPIDIIRKGTYNKVPMIFGYTDAEGLLQQFVDTMLNRQASSSVDLEKSIPYQIILHLGKKEREKIVDILKHLYADQSDPLDLHTDSWILQGVTEAVTEHLVTCTEPIYLFRMSIVTKLNYFTNLLQRFGRPVTRPGASHADDLGYLWHSEITPQFAPGSLEDQYVRIFVELWTNFAIFDNPNTNTNNKKLEFCWKPITNKDKLEVLDIGKSVEMKDMPERKRMEVWLNISKRVNL